VREQKGMIKAHHATGRPARQSSLVALGGSIDAPWGRMFAARPEISFSGGFSCVDLS
jgi:hypothetical protein